MRTIQQIRQDLFAMRDEQYKAFQSALMPAVPREYVIGVRMPHLRAYAKELLRDNEGTAAFLAVLPHVYHEENLLHACLLERERDFDRLLAETERFLPFLDDWSTCDGFHARAFDARYRDLLPHIERWLTAPQPFIVRYAIGQLMRYFLDDAFEERYLERVAAVTRQDYYIRTMVAWYFATALAKQERATLPYFLPGRLPEPTRKAALRKALESNRISPERKAFLRSIS